SSVSRSLRDCGVSFLAVQSPNDLAEYLQDNVRNTAGPEAGQRARMTVVQKGQRPKNDFGLLDDVETLLFHWPAMFRAGERTPLIVESPNGKRERILWSESHEYCQAVKTFAVKPEEALSLAFKGRPSW